jgi:hypothetical protein
VRHYFESLRPADLSVLHSVPDGLFLVRVDRAQYRWHRQKPYYEIGFACPKAQASDRLFDDRPPVLHAQGYVEAELVSA